jgi:hypothetical protein
LFFQKRYGIGVKIRLNPLSLSCGSVTMANLARKPVKKQLPITASRPKYEGQDFNDFTVALKPKQSANTVRFHVPPRLNTKAHFDPNHFPQSDQDTTLGLQLSKRNT